MCNEYDPALAILAEYTSSHNIDVFRICAVFGLGLAYIGTCRVEVLELILPSVRSANTGDCLAVVSCLACGMITVGTGELQVYTPIIQKLSERNIRSTIKPIYMTLAVLAMGLCCMELKDNAEHCLNEIEESMDESLRELAKTIVNMCAYAGSGDTKAIQSVLCLCYKNESVSEGQPSPVSKYEAAHN